MLCFFLNMTLCTLLCKYNIKQYLPIFNHENDSLARHTSGTDLSEHFRRAVYMCVCVCACACACVRVKSTTKLITLLIDRESDYGVQIVIILIMECCCEDLLVK